MAIRNIVKDGDEILRKVCKEVTVFDNKLATILDDMRETMYKADGVGLAAPQIGLLKRIAVVDVDRENYYELINPKITKMAGTQEGQEGCLSFPGEFGDVVRPKKVEVVAQDRNGKEYKLVATDLLARALCHEIDHLNGIVFKDKVKNLYKKAK